MTKSNIEFIKICIFCGNEFIAFKSTTKYCSQKCNAKAYKLNKRMEVKRNIDFINDKIRNQTYEELNAKYYLSVNEAAKLLGVCNKTIYNYIYRGKIKATRLSNRLTKIEQKDIKILFGFNHNYIKAERLDYNCVEDYYTIKEIKKLYGLKDARIWIIIRIYNIPTIKIGKFTHISKKHIDNYFRKKQTISQI